MGSIQSCPVKCVAQRERKMRSRLCKRSVTQESWRRRPSQWNARKEQCYCMFLHAAFFVVANLQYVYIYIYQRSNCMMMFCEICFANCIRTNLRVWSMCVFVWLEMKGLVHVDVFYWILLVMLCVFGRNSDTKINASRAFSIFIVFIIIGIRTRVLERLLD